MTETAQTLYIRDSKKPVRELVQETGLSRARIYAIKAKASSEPKSPGVQPSPVDLSADYKRVDVRLDPALVAFLDALTPKFQRRSDIVRLALDEWARSKGYQG